MTNKAELIEYLDELRTMLKNPNISVTNVEIDITPNYQDVIVGDKQIGRVVKSKEHSIRFTVRQ